MATLVRKNAWLNGGTFTNTDLLWYAKAVKVMMSRKLNDPTSWWFYAAIHGQYIINQPAGYPNWASIPPQPQVPTTPLPSNSLIAQYWDQCQHAGWFFAPWHRGYLYALENILRGIIVGLGGPSTWALPYWNYLKTGTNQYQIPPAFTAAKLPDNTPNPLFVTARFGPNGNGNIFVQIPPVSQQCQQATAYTSLAGRTNYGGGVTGFAHFANSTGQLENNPHNFVHGMVGGNSSTGIWGLMSDPGLAALDPIFYLHHCNIDRLWAAWNASGKTNPTDPAWLNGPTASGNRKFYMPKPDGTAWNYTPNMVNSIAQLNYTYDDIATLPHAVLNQNVLRLRRLGLPIENNKSINQVEKDETPELIGANTEPLPLGAGGANTSIKFDSSGFEKVHSSLLKASATALPDEVYLQLEGVKGNSDANMYTVSVNHVYAGHISLFGIRKASTADEHHGGAGLTIQLNISSIIDKLHINNALGESLDVTIQPVGANYSGTDCTIERISLYRVKN
jgi:tyrosinase